MADEETRRPTQRVLSPAVAVTSVSNGGASSSRRRNSPLSDRFLSLLGSPSSSSSAADGVDLDEDDVFWLGGDDSDFLPKPSPPPTPSAAAAASGAIRGRVGLRRMDSFGILAALPEDEVTEEDGGRGRVRPVLQRKSSISGSPSGRITISSVPKPPLPAPAEYSNSLPAGGRFQCQSAPVNVPMAGRRRRASEEEGKRKGGDEDDDEEEGGMLPPHEIVARGYSHVSPMTTFSVLEGAGRTLKGRDLRRVRNAIFRQTGFLD
ncbi:hypothetical protein QJS04_geneDACA011733 [Acorus gramineus]|uniref:Senescence regulator n=1 Tax=Acorus gramineus TaxID=55184 RepID=A0AAV9BHN1_ACOGR|nr:hypothetical protein QJS04_geneDACA011733 [Acorus gramineus]